MSAVVIPMVLAVPKKTIIAYSYVSITYQQAITTVVEKDEGGWTLTSDPFDNDGGWTYGGMTARKFLEYFPLIGKADIINLLTDPVTTGYLQQVVISIYYQDYLYPLIKILARNTVLRAFHLSCSINCGIGGFTKIYKNSIDLNISFLTAWKDYYFQLLKAKPDDVKYIYGWINRVFSYV